MQLTIDLRLERDDCALILMFFFLTNKYRVSLTACLVNFTSNFEHLLDFFGLDKLTRYKKFFLTFFFHAILPTVACTSHWACFKTGGLFEREKEMRFWALLQIYSVTS